MIYKHRITLTSETLFIQPNIPGDSKPRHRARAAKPIYTADQIEEKLKQCDDYQKQCGNSESVMQLFEACDAGNLEKIKSICKRVDMNSKDDDGKTGLLRACESNHQSAANWFMKQGCRINDVDKLGRTVLHWMAYYGNYIE